LADKDPKAKAPLVIKKYANRRLYNTEKSTYVTLDHLARMVRNGEDFVVQDAKTGEDITRSVLTQIIFEEEAKGQNMLPTRFLRQLIGLYGDALQGFVPGYLDASMDTFARNQEKMRAQVAQVFESNPALANFESLARTNMEWFENAMRMFAPFSAGAAMAENARREPPRDAPARNPDLDDLKSQLAAMQDQLSRLMNK
jgi:polyhydroxyalkanoate synthesis repressor PhaR